MIIIEHLKLLFHPIIINAFVYYDSERRVRHENWGDDINYYFLREIVVRPLVLLNRASLAFRWKFRNYLIIGWSRYYRWQQTIEGKTKESLCCAWSAYAGEATCRGG